MLGSWRLDGAHLARTDEAFERLERLLDRDGCVRRMHLVEVDHLRAEPAQARIACRADAVGGEARPAGLRDLEAHLRGEDDVVAMSGQPRGQRALGPAVLVDVGRVDEVAAGREEAIEDALGLVARGLAAHEHGAERQPADGQRTDGGRLHRPGC
jgi:hypothetical protein